MERDMKTAPLKMAVLVALAALTAPSIGTAQYYGDRGYYDDRRSTYDDRRSTYDERRSTYDDRRNTYDDRRSEYDGRRSIYGDRAIRAAVLESIEDSLGWRARFIEVHVNSGVVSLSGRVVSERERMLARQVADSVSGVRLVRARNLYTTGRNRY